MKSNFKRVSLVECLFKSISNHNFIKKKLFKNSKLQMETFEFLFLEEFHRKIHFDGTNVKHFY
jgi:hypothetical protein